MKHRKTVIQKVNLLLECTEFKQVIFVDFNIRDDVLPKLILNLNLFSCYFYPRR